MKMCATHPGERSDEVWPCIRCELGAELLATAWRYDARARLAVARQFREAARVVAGVEVAGE